MSDIQKVNILSRKISLREGRIFHDLEGVPACVLELISFGGLSERFYKQVENCPHTKYILHRSSDEPAVVYQDGTKLWYKNGLIHRREGPAVVCANGICMWFKDGKLHREGGPAIYLERQ